MAGGRVPGPLGHGGSGRLVNAPGPLGTNAGEAQLGYEAFKRAVLDQQIGNARRSGRNYYPPVPDNELEIVEGTHRMRRLAAQNCRALLAAARAALAAAKAANESKAIRATQIGLGSSYRDYAYDARLWERYYPDYYRDTQTKREAAPGGAHGPASVEILARHISPRKAAPGFSNHSNGMAVDFTTTVDNVQLTDKSSHEAWRQTWLHAWLLPNAATYQFYPLASEEWHWDYR